MKTRIEHDLLGEKEVPADAYYGIQTLRGIENFQNISGITIGDYRKSFRTILPMQLPGLVKKLSEANSTISSRSI